MRVFGTRVCQRSPYGNKKVGGGSWFFRETSHHCSDRGEKLAVGELPNPRTEPRKKRGKGGKHNGRASPLPYDKKATISKWVTKRGGNVRRLERNGLRRCMIGE